GARPGRGREGGRWEAFPGAFAGNPRRSPRCGGGGRWRGVRGWGARQPHGLEMILRRFLRRGLNPPHRVKSISMTTFT
ncbi:hypothetical protein Nmel_011665, partial [Mimus melanotis]